MVRERTLVWELGELGSSLSLGRAANWLSKHGPSSNPLWVLVLESVK